MKSLYRKYRPKNLTEVIGQPQVTEVLENAIKTGKVSHACGTERMWEDERGANFGARSEWF